MRLITSITRLLGSGASWLPRRRILALGLPLMAVGSVVVPPRASLSLDVIDLGVVARGERPVAVTMLRNRGLKSLTVTSDARSCGLIARVEGASSGIQVGRASTVTIDVDTTLWPEGESTRHLAIKTNDPFHSLTVTLRVNVRSEWAVKPAVLYLAADRRTVTAKLLRTGTDDRQVLKVITTDPLITARVELGRDGSERPEYVVSVRPASPGGALPWNLGNIVISTDSVAMPEIRIPVRGVFGSLQ